MVRIEKDSLGVVDIADDVLYGVQTARAITNFQITGQYANPEFFTSLAKIKKACALANFEVGDLSQEVCDAICQSCDEIIAGSYYEYFVTDVIQGGAGTSLNMNINEIIANRSAQILGKDLGVYDVVHPNDHVNRSQSTNDIIPTAGKLTTYLLGQELIRAINQLSDSFASKGDEYQSIIKVGRTHLQDAVLISMGQVFHSYETMLRREVKRIEHALEEMLIINLGATAVGTGINSLTGYREAAVKNLCDITGLKFESAEDLIDGTKHIDGFAYVHSSLKSLASSLSKMCNDLRLMASGPKVGISEIILPGKQPGSSIMPGKVNPVIPEVVNQIAFQVIGNDLTVTMAVEAGQMELNVFEPVLFKNLFESLMILTNACDTLRIHAIDGLIVNKSRIEHLVDHSLAMATALVKELGYQKVSDITQEALDTNRSIREIVLEKKLIDEEKLQELLRPETMIAPKNRP
ncbi:aspartate ammonia-lyase [Erysipelothrix sp. HDW6A]|uniref:aspartate ammonia-lyase n=1 Tax=Erysipelothrix sp. HDW6A TaxID=2714928 RepID=UPI001409C2E6|nr:aspartate ammonia-lyase [Erysipelothrix sp. HDW6A]QIK56488.1 aspartate ammonia-lyase [Erysipelothrix sp. HDW6A]